MYAITCAGAGGPEVLRYTELPDPLPAEGELLIETRAAGVNRADVLQRQGHYPQPPGASPLLGLEVSGRVLVGAGAFAPGDEVVALLAGGGYATRVCVDARHALPLPKGLSLEVGGGLLEVFLTAYLNLTRLAELRAGERVLIHGGSGGVGQAAIQWARHLGAEVWATASAPKLERCRALGARALDYGSEDFCAALQDTGGADVILDIMGASYLERNLQALAPDGRLVLIGLQGGLRAEVNLGRVLARRLRVQGSTLRSLSAERKGSLLQRFHEEVLPAMASGALRPVPHASCSLRDAAQAHHRLEAGDTPGKLVLLAD